MSDTTIRDILHTFSENEVIVTGICQERLRDIVGIVSLLMLQPKSKTYNGQLWYSTPVNEWDTHTYAIFMISCITSFFDPAFDLGEPGPESSGATTVVEVEKLSGEDFEAILGQFGRFLRFIHRESAHLTALFEPIWAFGPKLPKSSLGKTHPRDVARRVLKVWQQCRSLCDNVGNDKQQISQLNDCIMRTDVHLLQKVLDIPEVMASMLIHYYSARFPEMVNAKVAASMGEANKPEEVIKEDSI